MKIEQFRGMGLYEQLEQFPTGKKSDGGDRRT
jgi:hypothetical protein